jgi:hypothetical protein
MWRKSGSRIKMESYLPLTELHTNQKIKLYSSSWKFCQDLKSWIHAYAEHKHKTLIRWEKCNQGGVIKTFVNFNSCDLSTHQLQITKSIVISSDKCNANPDNANHWSLYFQILNYSFDLLILVDFALDFWFSSSALATWSSTTFIFLNDSTIFQSLINFH